MKKIWLGVYITILMYSVTACTTEPPDLYMTPASNEGVASSGKKPLIILDSMEAETDQRPEYAEQKTEIQEMNQLMYVIEGVNIRESNRLDAPVISSLEAGVQVQVTGKCDNGWYRIIDHAKEAYVNGEYLSETMDEVQLAVAEPTTEKETTRAEETTKAPETTKASETTPAQNNTEAVTEGAAEPETEAQTEPETEAQTEPETTKTPIKMVNTYTLTGVITNIGTYGFTVQGKDNKSHQFSCAPDVTASMNEGSYVVVKYNSEAETGKTELVSVSGQ